jgi:hypothetical protein
MSFLVFMAKEPRLFFTSMSSWGAKEKNMSYVLREKSNKPWQQWYKILKKLQTHISSSIHKMRNKWKDNKILENLLGLISSSSHKMHNKWMNC